MTFPYSHLQVRDPEVYAIIRREEDRLREGINLIPSENYAYPEVLEALGSVFNDKYAEGYPGKRYYGGTQYADEIETLAIERAKKIFRAEHANVQPLSGSPMNQAVYFAFAKPGDTILAMDLTHGGHLTHGHPVSHMGTVFNFVRYKTHPDEHGRIDFAELRTLALEHRPKIVMCGYTSYPRDYDYTDFKRIADEVGAISFADVSHIGGLIAGGAMRNPLDYGFDVMATTTHKSLRWPRGGLILCKKEFAKQIDKSVFPWLQGWPHLHFIAALAACLKRVDSKEFQAYAHQVLANAKALADELMTGGAKLITDGTDNHMMVMDCVASFGFNGVEAERVLTYIGITTNKQIIPDDTNPPLKPSGIRLGTPAATSRNLQEDDIREAGRFILRALRSHNDLGELETIRMEVLAWAAKYPVPSLV